MYTFIYLVIEHKVHHKNKKNLESKITKPTWIGNSFLQKLDGFAPLFYFSQAVEF